VIGRRAIVLAAAVLAAAGCASLGRRPTFPTVPARFSVPELASRTTAFYSPEGAGPFPAVVLLHSCAGLKRSTVWYWAGRLTTAGYAVLVVDSFGPRGVESVCGTEAVPVDQVADDAFAALAHLRSLPSIDGDRVAVVGFSWGAMAGLRTASAASVRSSGAPGFRAVVAFYPWCQDSHPNARVQALRTHLYPDVVTPTLILVGSADDETPAAQCEQAVDTVRRAGKPVAIKVYPGATHVFDGVAFGDKPFVNSYGGRRFVYRYDPAATADAEKEMKDFLARRLRGSD